MSKWTALSSSQHATKHYLPRQAYAFATDQNTIPILIAELSKLLPHYVLAFIPQDNTYSPVAIVGLGKQNLYLNPDGKWLAPYVPTFLRSYPFRLLPSENKLVFCIQEDHLSDDQGQPLFDDEGNLTKPVQDTLNFLNQCEKNRKVTQAACQSLYQAGVIEKWDLQVKQSEDNDPVKLDGLYRISEKALNELDKETFADLRKNGALGLAYAQLFSMGNISVLDRLAKYHAQQQQKEPAEEDVDIEQLFGDDATLNFDNI